MLIIVTQKINCYPIATLSNYQVVYRIVVVLSASKLFFSIIQLSYTKYLIVLLIANPNRGRLNCFSIEIPLQKTAPSDNALTTAIIRSDTDRNIKSPIL